MHMLHCMFVFGNRLAWPGLAYSSYYYQVLCAMQEIDYKMFQVAAVFVFL